MRLRELRNEIAKNFFREAANVERKARVAAALGKCAFAPMRRYLSAAFNICAKAA
jgi:hypothetical protein